MLDLDAHEAISYRRLDRPSARVFATYLARRFLAEMGTKQARVSHYACAPVSGYSS